MPAPDLSFYVTGGTVPRGSLSYVSRQADEELYRGLNGGEFCYVLTPRQMGKSSLMVRTAGRLAEAGVTVVVLDLTAIGQNVTAEQWYDGLLNLVGRQLRLEEEMEAFWLANRRLGPLQRFFAALRDVALPRLAERGGREELVVFVDEIDAIRSLPFPTDEFFAAIRQCYNRRTTEPEFQRLAFCLLGVASPADLIRDSRSTPFNIGRRIELHDFTEEEAAPLAAGFAHPPASAGPASATNTTETLPPREARALLRRVLYWTSGHPYLTQRLCQAIVECRSQPVDRLCHALFFLPGAVQREDNLLFVQDRLLRSEAGYLPAGEVVAAVLELYRQAWEGKRVALDDANPLVELLRLSGVVRIDRPAHPGPSAPSLLVRNRIYARVFDRKWIQAHLPDAELRRQRAAYRRGLARAAALAGAALGIMAMLAGAAVAQAHRADHHRRLAVRRAGDLQQLAAQLGQTLREKELLLGRLQNALGAEQAARGRVGHEAAQKRLAARRANTQAAAAKAARRKAETDRKRAETEERLAHERLGRLYFSNGKRYEEEGDLTGALPWLAEAMRVGRPDRGRHDLERRHFAAVAAECPPLAQVFFHPAPVSDAAFSPDGRYVVTGCGGDSPEPRQAQVWEVASGRAVGPLLRHPAGVCSAAFSPDGRRVVTGCKDGTARTWEARTGREIGPPLRHRAQVQAAAFSPDGSRIVTASYDGTGRVWDGETGRPVTPPLLHRAQVHAVSFSPDGSRIATASFDGTARLWDARTGRETSRLQHGGGVVAARFSPDGRRVVTASRDGTARIWETSTGQSETPPLTHPNASVLCAAFSPDGRQVVTGCTGDYARVWNAASGQPVTEPLVHHDWVASASFSPDGLQVVTACRDGTARVWELGAGAGSLARPATPPLRHGHLVSAAQFSPDGRRVLTASDDGTARIWDLAGGQTPPARMLAHGARAGLLAFSPDGKRLFTAGGDSTVQVWDGASGKPVLPPFVLSAEVSAAAFSADGRRLVAGCRDGTLHVCDLTTGRAALPPVRHSTRPVGSVAVSPDGATLAAGGDDSVLRLWDARTGSLRWESPEHRLGPRAAAILHVSFSPDGRRLASAGADQAAHVWDVQSGKPVCPPLRHRHDVYRAWFSPDGRRLLTASRDSTARVWEVATGRPVTPPLAHRGPVYAAVFSPDGQRVLTGSGDRTARVWDARSGTARTPPMLHPRYVGFDCVSFSPDGRQVLTVTDGNTRLWDAASGEPVSPPLVPSPSVVRGLLSPDGRRVAVLTPSDDGIAWVWDLPRAPGFAANPGLQARLLSNQRVDPNAGPVAMDGAAFRRTWEAARRQDPPAASAGSVFAWHWRKAEELERQQRWAAAAGHYSAAIQLRPELPAVWLRRSHALRALRQWDRVLSDLTRALALQPDAYAARRERAETCMQVGRAADARADFERLLVRSPDHLQLRRQLALAQLALDEEAGYRGTCAALLARFGTTTDPSTANNVAWTCAIHPAAEDPTAALRLAERAVAAQSRNPVYLNTLGAVLYRAGRFEEAVRRLNEAITAHGRGGTPEDWLFLAMAHHRLDRVDPAREWLARFTTWMQTGQNLAALSWNSQLELQLLGREAGLLVGGDRKRGAGGG